MVTGRFKCLILLIVTQYLTGSMYFNRRILH